MTREPKYKKYITEGSPDFNLQLKRWYENLKAHSVITADTYFRHLLLWCERDNTNPTELLELARRDDFRYRVMDIIRKFEAEGKAGSYISYVEKPLISWLKFNGINVKLSINIKDDNRNIRSENERVPSKEELGKILRMATPRARVSISLMAYSGLRPEALGDYEGTDCLRLSDIEGVKISSTGVEFEKIPAKIRIRSNLSKARNEYFTFLGKEGLDYLAEYLGKRVLEEEKLTFNSPVLQLDPKGEKKRGKERNEHLRTALVARDIKKAIVNAGFNWRPYVLRAYFSTALDIVESKGLISHPWRQFIMGHKGDIEARYSTNKRLPPDMIEEMRESYKKCLRFLETRISEVSEDNAKLFIQQQLLSAVGYKQEEIDKIDLKNISNEEFQQLLRDKVAGAMTENGAKQKVIPVSDVEKYIQEGYDFEAVLPNGKAVMRLRF
ncbi:MAG: site-specific integrase [Candidatus Thermoplasmatota archaeon]|nr:site-specific integrase [Candidatus Thermoplasmatota archaeon]